MGKIFIADDEKNIRDLLGKFLEDAGHEDRLFENGDSREFDNLIRYEVHQSQIWLIFFVKS